MIWRRSSWANKWISWNVLALNSLNSFLSNSTLNHSQSQQPTPLFFNSLSHPINQISNLNWSPSLSNPYQIVFFSLHTSMVTKKLKISFSYLLFSGKGLFFIVFLLFSVGVCFSCLLFHCFLFLLSLLFFPVEAHNWLNPPLGPVQPTNMTCVETETRHRRNWILI